ncbi:MAG: hypothetical protein ABIQ56_00800 [Chitinophagaceae bacterium]
MKINLLFRVSVAAFVICSCKQEKKSETSTIFQQTWYAGKAELSSYTLQQSRYGEIRNGEAVLIFVTEDFSTDKLVKLDDPGKTSNKLRVLKMNMTKKFFTGVYPYSMMLSVFTPVSNDGKEKTLKVDCSSQEWCGQTYSQLLLKGNNYHWQLHSYFEKEGEQEKELDNDLLEDELWNRIRINPATLPTGKISILPGLLWQRLSHNSIRKENAVLSLSGAGSNGMDSSIKIYSIEYPSSDRTLKIYFNDFFPYEILGWEETYPDGFGKDKKMLTTKAVRKKITWLDYWKHNALADSTYRDTLQLMHYE